MKYDINSKNYLGSTEDMTGRTVQGFKIEKDIHIVYDINLDTEWVTTKPIEEVLKNIDDYLFTPYAVFVAKYL